jgi:putative transposase
MKSSREFLTCKLCGSENIVKFGFYHGIQRWWCKDCRHKFAANDALPGMKTPAQEVASALELYFEGVHLNEISQILCRAYEIEVSSTSVYNWVVYFSRLVSREASNARINVGNIWTMTEMAIPNDIKDTRLSLMDIVDNDSRLLLASKISDYRNQYDIKCLIQAASDRVHKVPREIITDGWQGFRHGIDLALGTEGRHVTVATCDVKRNNENLRCWYLAQNDRTRILRGLKKKNTMQLVVDGWAVHYNFFKHHASLNGKTTSEISGSTFRFHNWQEAISGINQNSVQT